MPSSETPGVRLALARVEPGAIAVVVGVGGLAFAFPGGREIAAALGLKPSRELATGSHRIEDGDGIVDPADREQGAGTRVLDGGDVGTEDRRFVDERERFVWIALGIEDGARAIVEVDDALGGIEAGGVEGREEGFGVGAAAGLEETGGTREIGGELAAGGERDGAANAVAAKGAAELADLEGAVGGAWEPEDEGERGDEDDPEADRAPRATERGAQDDRRGDAKERPRGGPGGMPSGHG